MKKVVLLLCIISLLSSCAGSEQRESGKGTGAIVIPDEPIETNF